MLLDNIMKKGDVVTIKLSAGEEIVGTLVKHDSSVIRLSRPLCVVIDPSTNQPALAPFLMTAASDADLEFNMTTVVTILRSADQFAKAYNSATSSIVS